MTLRCSIVLCGYIETAAEPREYLEKQLGFKAPKEEIYNAYHWVPQEKKRKEKKGILFLPVEHSFFLKKWKERLSPHCRSEES
jgi:hypothetical protein